MELVLQNKKNLSGFRHLNYKPILNKCNFVIPYEAPVLDIRVLKEAIIYFNDLYKKKTINDKQFKDILAYIFAQYIEGEIESRVSCRLKETLYGFLEKINEQF